MGLIFSRWRKSPSPVDELEKIEKNLLNLERNKEGYLQSQKKILGSLILYSFILYLAVAIFYYKYYTPEDITDRILYFFLPLVVFPILIYLVKRVVQWYFVKQISKYESQIQALNERKNSILEEVMEKETFKVAKEILEKYNPEKLQGIQNVTPKVEVSPPNTPSKDSKDKQPQSQASTPAAAKLNNSQQHSLSGNNVKPTPGANTTRMPLNVLSNPVISSTPIQTSTPSYRRTNQLNTPGAAQLREIPTMPKPILPRERGVIDRLVDYFVGDGPENRYALVCIQCQSHNGMALKEEFEYIAFRCCYCYTFNPAKKLRPNAPKILFNAADNSIVKDKGTPLKAGTGNGEAVQAFEKVGEGGIRFRIAAKSKPAEELKGCGSSGAVDSDDITEEEKENQVYEKTVL